MLKKKLYLAYGSNLNIKQMEWRCPTAVVRGTAIINDFELLFRGHRHSAVATIEPFKGGIVPVIVWEIRPADEYALDRYEGFPHFYQKETLTVNFNGADVKAMAYIMTAGRALGAPSSEYYHTISEGYKTAGFDPAILHNAVVESLERQHD